MTTEENGTTETAESSQPEVHVSPAEEENPDESETLGTILPILPEKPSVTTEENGTTELQKAVNQKSMCRQRKKKIQMKVKH